MMVCPNNHCQATQLQFCKLALPEGSVCCAYHLRFVTAIDLQAKVRFRNVFLIALLRFSAALCFRKTMNTAES